MTDGLVLTWTGSEFQKTGAYDLILHINLANWWIIKVKQALLK